MEMKVSEILENNLSGEWGEECIDTTGTKVIRTTNFTNDGTLNLSKIVLRKIAPNKLEQKKLKYGDTIIEKSGGSPSQPVGRVVFFDEKNETFLCNNFTNLLRVKKDIVDCKYFFYFMFYNHL